MNCEEFLGKAKDWLDGKVHAAVCADLRAHEDACLRCGPLMQVARETTCRDVADFLDDYLDGSMPAERRAVFERHLGICPECEDYLGSYKRTVELAAGAYAAPPADIPERLVRAIREARAAQRKPDA
jgi:hypothetical protein